MHVLRSLQAPDVTGRLRPIVAQFGLVTAQKTVKSVSFSNFSRFADELDFSHHRVTRRLPEANGEVERFIRALEKLIVKI